jgi:penicillin-binding protein 2
VDCPRQRHIQHAAKIQAPIAGKRLVLSIDSNIQKIAEADALGKRQGSIVVLKPATGEVLAMVTYSLLRFEGIYVRDNAGRGHISIS